MDIEIKIILAVVVIQVFFTLWTIIAMGIGRVNAVKNGELTLKDVALDNKVYPDDVLKLGNNMQNQFETPVLLYAGAAIATSVGANWVMVGASVVFLASRFLHRWIHVRNNRVTPRFKMYLYGLVALSVFWAALAVQIVIS